jgi:colicin import membrane protein
MEGFRGEPSSHKLFETKWHNMLILSTAFHLAIFSMLLFVPDPMPTRSIQGPIYEVNLVEMPRVRRAKDARSYKTKSDKKLLASKKTAPAKRISRSEKKEKPVVIAKRTVKTKRKKGEKPELSSSKALDQALSKIKRKVQAEKKSPIEQAISKLEAQSKGDSEERFLEGAANSGITIRIYQMDVENRIKSNWSYPVALLGPGSQKDLESIVVIRVRSNGAIMNSWFKKRSSNVIFNQSVLKAIERSDPLPHFPEGYRKTYDEIEINFNLRDLEEH